MPYAAILVMILCAAFFYRLGNVEEWKAFPVKYQGPSFSATGMSIGLFRS